MALINVRKTECFPDFYLVDGFTAITYYLMKEN